MPVWINFIEDIDPLVMSTKYLDSRYLIIVHTAQSQRSFTSIILKVPTFYTRELVIFTKSLTLWHLRLSLDCTIIWQPEVCDHAATTTATAVKTCSDTW